jgi:predicted MFS family arabinose efflux permease
MSDTPTASAAFELTGSAGRRVQAALCVSAFLAALNFFAPTPFYPEMARDLQTTVPLLGQVVTLMALMSAVLGLAVGPLADRYGFRWPLVFGLLALAVNLAGMALAPAYAVLLGLGVIGGLGDALVFALPLAIAGTIFAGDARRRAIGWTLGALSVAPIVGVPLLTAFGSVSGWRAALGLAGLAGAGAAWFVASALPPDHRAPEAPLRLSSLLAAYLPLLRDPPVLRLFGVTALRALAWLGLITYLGGFLGEAVGLETQQIGFVYMVAGGGYVLGSVLAGGRMGGLSPRAGVAVASIVTGLVLGPMLIAAQAVVVIPAVIIGSFAAAVVGVGVTTLLAAESPAGAATTMVLNGSILNFGAAVAAAFGGVLIAVGGYAALGVALPLFAFLAAVLAWWPGDRRRSQEKADCAAPEAMSEAISSGP